MHFRLTFKPANFTKAVATYEKWMKILTTHDWPLRFSKPIADLANDESNNENENDNDCDNDDNDGAPCLDPPSTPYPPPIPTQQKQHLSTEFDEFIAFRKRERLRMRLLNQQGGETNKENQQVLPATTCNNDDDHDDEDDEDDSRGICESIQWRIHGDPDASTPVPETLEDIVYANYQDSNSSTTTIPSSIHAKRRLPINTPLGFYFGTPTTEDEFELFKEDQGNATKYCVMYGRTVLDATDDQGQLFLDDSKVYCPFHFMRQAATPDLANVFLLKGKIYNQVICWTKRTIQPHEELLVWLECEK